MIKNIDRILTIAYFFGGIAHERKTEPILCIFTAVCITN